MTRKYYVQFMYLEDKSENAEIFQILHDENLSVASATHTQETDQPDVSKECGFSIFKLNYFKTAIFISVFHCHFSLMLLPLFSRYWGGGLGPTAKNQAG